MRRIFVVGSLRRGEYNHRRFEGFADGFAGTATAAGFVLKDLGEFPAMVPSTDPRDLVVGELYDVSDDLAHALDRFEANDGYFPRPLTVVDQLGVAITAEAYCIEKPDSVAHHATVPGGDWVKRGA